MRYLILLEQTEAGFAVQVPDLAISTYGRDISSAKKAAIKAIRINLETYSEIGKPVPTPIPIIMHLENLDVADILFSYVELVENKESLAA
jgi:predicted RNase H-like HicB family nuclease